MIVYNKHLEDYIKKENHDAINEYLIEISKSPQLKNLLDVEYLINNSPDSFLYHFVINLIYLLGEISRNHFLSDYYIKFLIETFFKSDRWIRKEILSNFLKSIRIDDLFQKISDVIEFALVDDYEPIIFDALMLTYHAKKIPDRFYPKIIKNLDSKNSKIVQESIKVLKKYVKSTDMLYEILLKENSINLYRKPILRSLLMIFFDEVHQVEEFKVKIMNSDLDLATKRSVISEINIYRSILQKRIS